MNAVVVSLLQLLYPLDAEEVVDKIDEILTNYEINWKTILLVISVIHVIYAEGSKTVKGRSVETHQPID